MVSPGLADALVRGLITGSIIAAGALSLSLIYSIAEVPNFAHGDMITIGAYLAIALNVPGEIPFLPDVGGVGLFVAAVGALVLAGGLGAGYELLVFRKFRAKGADLITMVIVSLGLALILRHVVLFLVGSKNIRYDTATVRSTNYDTYLTTGGITVEAIQRQAGDLVTLATWGYSWPRVFVVVGLAVASAFAIYRWRSADAGYETVHFVSPRVLAVTTFATVFVALAALLASGPLGTDSPLWATRIGLSSKHLVIVGVVVAMMVALNLLLKTTKLGVAMRATADDGALARIKGVDVDRVQLVVWVVGGVTTALAGVLMGWFASNLNPNMGFSLLLPIFAAVILGGITSPYGAVLGSLLIGVSMDVGVHLLPAEFATYRTAIAFVILVAVLIVEPEGLWGDV